MTISHPDADSHEIRALTGIRGFAAILVMCFHFYGVWVTLVPAISWAGRPISRGGIGVDLFFILSGFILCYVYNVGGKKLTLSGYGKFLWFRLARVYPNHLATLFVLILMVAVASVFKVPVSRYYPFDDLPFQLTLTHSWFFAPQDAVSVWNFPAWSISAEWFAYLAIFPLLAFFLQRIRSSAAVLVLGFGALAVWSVIGGDSQPGSDGRSMVQVSLEFFAGGMVFRFFQLGGGMVLFCQRCASIFFVALIVLLFCPESLVVATGILFVLPVLLLGLTSEVSLVARLFATPFALWLGRVSYSLYMTHGIALKVIKVILPFAHYAHSSLVLRGLVILTDLVIIFTMAACLYYLVEIPSRNYLRKIRPFQSPVPRKPGSSVPAKLESV